MFAKQWRFLDKRSPRWRYFSDSLKVEESIQMRIPTPIQALSAAAALALLAGCSSGSAIAPTSNTLQGHHVVMNSGRVPSVLNPVGMLKLRNLGGFQPNHKASYDSCPASGTIIYMSDFNTSTINIYKGGNTTPLVLCGQITGSVVNPQGMIVKAGNLYVANTGGFDVEGFHRGATTPFITYTDPTCSGQFPVDVTVSSDNFVFATNIFGGACAGSISIFHKSGAYVSTIANPSGFNDYFLTIQNNGQLYTDDNSLSLNTASCPGGACGAFSNTGAVMNFPGGVRSEDGEDVVLDDQSGTGGGTVTTYEPPTFSSGGVCTVGGSDPVTFDVNHSQHHMFLADAGLNQLTELKYTNTTGACAPKFTAPGNTSGLPIGAAVDRAESLN
jgi:hypothetical protein